MEELPASPVHLVVGKDPVVLRQDLPVQWQYITGQDDAEVEPVTCNSSDGPSEEDSACRTAMGIPEVVENILKFVDECSPLSITSNTSTQTRRQLAEPNSSAQKEAATEGCLSACAHVNWTFYWAAKRILSTRVELTSMEQINRYCLAKAGSDDLCRDLVIHRVKTCEQTDFDRIDQSRLRSLELYVCPKLVPTRKVLESGTLLKIALPGCGLVDDMVMSLIATYCRALEILDLRACELVSDLGIMAIADSCPRLSYLNVGRVKNSNGITNQSLIRICQKTSVETLGLAGCSIGDEGVSAIAEHRGSRIERLSMNQCHSISDYSVNAVLGMCPKLQVLEVVGCVRVKDAEQLCRFKIATGALVETSAPMAMKMKLYERQIRSELDRSSRNMARAQRRVTTI